MPLPPNVIANADDFGYNSTVNEAIKICFQKGYINSTSLLTNMSGFGGAVKCLNENLEIINIGLHINLAEGKPLINVPSRFLNADGCWNLSLMTKPHLLLNNTERAVIYKEVTAQFEKAIDSGVSITHIDSHYHLHTLPALSNIVISLAKKQRLPIRLAQTYREGSYVKFWYRKFVNNRIYSYGLNYSDFFETVNVYLNQDSELKQRAGVTEVMLHPDLDSSGKLIDHVEKETLDVWTKFIEGQADPETK